MTKCSVFIATSLDGFIAREDGSIDWLEQANRLVPAGEDCGYSQFMAGIDAIVIGRRTFEQVLGFGTWVYASTPVIVLSCTLKALPPGVPATVSLSNEDPKSLVARLSKEGLNHLYVDGGQTIQSFLAADLIDEMTLTLIPLLIGAGRRLFGALAQDRSLELLESKAYPFGFVQSRYRVVK